MPALRYVLLVQRDLPKALRFYSEGLGLAVRTSTERWAELEGCSGFRLALQAADRGPCRSAGHASLLVFDVPDLQGTLMRLLQLGATMDGKVHYLADGKVTAVRAPDGQALGLVEGQC